MQRAIMQLNPFLSVIYLMGKLFKLYLKIFAKNPLRTVNFLDMAMQCNAMEGSQVNCCLRSRPVSSVSPNVVCLSVSRNIENKGMT